MRKIFAERAVGFDVRLALEARSMTYLNIEKTNLERRLTNLRGYRAILTLRQLILPNGELHAFPEDEFA